jgi:hypothetical protein
MDTWDGEIARLSGMIDSFRNRLCVVQKEKEKYDTWMSKGSYTEHGLGYFNCLPTEVTEMIVKYSNSFNLLGTCKTFKGFLHNIMIEKLKENIGNAYKYFDEHYPDKFDKWHEIMKDKNYIIGYGYIIKIVSIDSNKIVNIFNYTDEYWEYNDEEFHINSMGYYIISLSLDSYVMHYDKGILVWGECYQTSIDGDTVVYVPMERECFEVYMDAIKRGVIYRNIKDIMLKKYGV